MINVFLNAQTLACSESTNLQDLIEQHAGQGPFAVALNETFIPKTHYAETALNEGDRIEIVSPMQGG